MTLEDCISGINPDTREKPFYRKIFHECSQWVMKENTPVLILTGPRRCGKSVCLKQVAEKHNGRYYDFKAIPNVDERNRIIEDIVCGLDEGIFVLDEITQLDEYPSVLSMIADSITKSTAITGKCSKKILISGSQSYAIRKAGYRAFATDAKYLSTSFIDFEEWLLFRSKISEYGESYLASYLELHDYMLRSNEFTKVRNNLDYIQASLDETVLSELKNRSGTIGQVLSDNLRAEEVLSVLYGFLCSLHNKYSYASMRSYKRGLIGIRTGNIALSKDIKQSELESRIDKLFVSIPCKIPKSEETVKEIIMFLLQTDLVSIREVVRLGERPIAREYFREHSDIHLTVENIFRKFNICVKHPMFFFNLVRELLYDHEDIEPLLSTATWGSALECLIAGLLSYKYGDFGLCECEDVVNGIDIEVDILVPSTREAFEVTVAPRHNTTGLNSLDESYTKTLIKEGIGHVGELSCVDYVQYVLDNSRGLFSNRQTEVHFR